MLTSYTKSFFKLNRNVTTQCLAHTDADSWWIWQSITKTPRQTQNHCRNEHSHTFSGCLRSSKCLNKLSIQLTESIVGARMIAWQAISSESMSSSTSRHIIVSAGPCSDSLDQNICSPIPSSSRSSRYLRKYFVWTHDTLLEPIVAPWRSAVQLNDLQQLNFSVIRSLSRSTSEQIGLSSWLWNALFSGYLTKACSSMAFQQGIVFYLFYCERHLWHLHSWSINQK